MKVIDVYNQNKAKYDKYVILIRVGIFYETYGDDVYILNNLFNYKVKDINGVKRVGFPINSYNKVTEKLNKFKINYLIIDNEIIKKKFNKNNYNQYVNFDMSIDDRIYSIFNKLMILKANPSIDNILNKIEEML